MNKIQIERQYWVLRNRFVGLEKEHNACKAAINALNLENESLKQTILDLEAQKAELESKVASKKSTRRSRSSKKSD